MSLFTSVRERRFWYWAALVQFAIYATLGLTGRLVDFLVDRRLVDEAFVAGFFMLVAAILWSGLTASPKNRDVWVVLGVVAAFSMLFPRLFLTERTHLFEYGLVGVLVYQALLERRRNGRRVPVPALLAIVAVALLGWLDEGIQALLPNRVYDLRDVGFNALAGLVSVGGSAALHAARMWWARRRA